MATRRPALLLLGSNHLCSHLSRIQIYMFHKHCCLKGACFLGRESPGATQTRLKPIGPTDSQINTQINTRGAGTRGVMRGDWWFGGCGLKIKRRCDQTVRAFIPTRSFLNGGSFCNVLILNQEGRTTGLIRTFKCTVFSENATLCTSFE